jgi:hypothetical protein
MLSPHTIGAADAVRFPQLALPKLELLFEDGSSTWLHEVRGADDLFMRDVDDKAGRIRVNLRHLAPELEVELKGATQRDRAGVMFFTLRHQFANADRFLQAAREHAQ